MADEILPLFLLMSAMPKVDEQTADLSMNKRSYHVLESYQGVAYLYSAPRACILIWSPNVEPLCLGTGSDSHTHKSTLILTRQKMSTDQTNRLNGTQTRYKTCKTKSASNTRIESKALGETEALDVSELLTQRT